MFRIYRDTRFSKDKTPYKTHFSAALGDRSKRGLGAGLLLPHRPRGHCCSPAAASIVPHPPILLTHSPPHRVAQPEALVARAARPRFKATYGGLADEDALARPPKGFAADTPHIDAIKLRHFFGMVRRSISSAIRRATSRARSPGISAICCR